MKYSQIKEEKELQMVYTVNPLNRYFKMLLQLDQETYKAIGCFLDLPATATDVNSRVIYFGQLREYCC